MYLHFVVDLDGVLEVGDVRRNLRDPLLKVEHVHGKLVRLGAGGPEQLGRVLHEGLVGLQMKCTVYVVKFGETTVFLSVEVFICFFQMKHHAAVQSARERYISCREEMLNNFLRIFSRRLLYRSQPWHDASNVKWHVVMRVTASLHTLHHIPTLYDHLSTISIFKVS